MRKIKNYWEELVFCFLLIALFGAFIFLVADINKRIEQIKQQHQITSSSLTINFAGCQWTPPSAAASIGTLMYFYGVGSEEFINEFKTGLLNQYLAAGKTPEQAQDGVKELETCINNWPMKK